MNTYKLDSDGFNEIKSKTLKKTIPIALTAVFAGLYISSFNQNSDLDTILIIIPVLLIATGFGLFKGLKRQKLIWNTYELTIDAETISRTQNNVPTIRIYKSDILEIIEFSDGNIHIKTGEKHNLIHIPSTILNRTELLSTLTDLRQITKRKSRKSGKDFLIMSLVSIGLMIVFFTSKERIIIVPSGIILVLGLIWSFIETQRSKHIDKKTKRTSYFIFLLLFSIIARLLIELEIFGF